MKIVIQEESQSDIQSIEDVTIEAFASAEHTSHTEQFIVRSLRNSNMLTVSLVAKCEDTGKIVGHIAASPITINNNNNNNNNDTDVNQSTTITTTTTKWYGLAPLSVLPAYQNKGIGTLLVDRLLRSLKDIGADGCVVLGSPKYYGRFGFKADSTKLVLPNVPPEYFQLLQFNHDSNNSRGCIPIGIVSFHSSFDAVN
ncbi:hypothetical protein DFA_06180 [Cavenderia fasciculata]|uniref:N-acetyltransferase domain-containing protein n=1 Tax=Cavenderia fasciculata TaxID=261658 RepID=F4PKB8_CACFS|nr:uncharacterized protein DFA_06180 [Cavenderia fasciculata]EGG24042.1 hypothetical protein DFA_06180 [Cavenderia fasciculata]|eukprot:XP_004361893.1 hypothetical protein DFA_06180 [Cavenderia fasciculata]